MTFATSLPNLRLPSRVTRVPGCYWRPTDEFVQELTEFLKGKKVLEIFAGNGYLAGLLGAQGISVISTTRFSGHDAHPIGLYAPVIEREAVAAVHEFGAESDVLLICWPTVTAAALEAVKAWGSEKDFVFIGEVSDARKGYFGGCATDEFFEWVSFTRKFETYRGNMLEIAAVGRLQPGTRLASP